MEYHAYGFNFYTLAIWIYEQNNFQEIHIVYIWSIVQKQSLIVLAEL